MKRRYVFALGLLLDLGIQPLTSGQTPSELSIQVYAGLSITGKVGTVYSISFVTDLSRPNNQQAWRCLEFLQLAASPYMWVDTSAPATGQRYYRASEFTAPTNMVFIAPGTFRMGSPSDERDRSDMEGPQTEVTISRGFWMGKCEVTQAEYLAVIGSNPSFFNGDHTAEGWGNYGVDLNRPVERVSWRDATNYCNLLTQRSRAEGRIPTNSVYRLPTEAEWEYACRAWTSTRFSFGDDLGFVNLNRYAWSGPNSGGMTHPVGQKSPNLRGLYDTHGNVSEWCYDLWQRYLGGTALDPSGPTTIDPTFGDVRVFRGGDFADGGEDQRSAARAGDGVGSLDNAVGFRVVLTADRP